MLCCSPMNSQAQKWALDWFEKVHDYAFSHYPVPRYGEWTQKLDRQGQPFIRNRRSAGQGPLPPAASADQCHLKSWGASPLPEQIDIDDSPNLLFLITDQQRADTVEPQTACQTPNLDRLAARGTHFRRCYTVNPICSPTRASLMTGLLPHSHGMVDVTHAVPAYRASFDPDAADLAAGFAGCGLQHRLFRQVACGAQQQLENFGFETYEVEQYHQKLGLVEWTRRDG